MILADLDRELAARVADLVADGTLPPEAAQIEPGRTWRPAPDGDPAGFATSMAFELAAIANRSPADVAAWLAAPLAELRWVTAVERTGRGYLTITVAARALGQAAASLAAAGPAAGRSTILGGTTAATPPWPDLATAAGWRQAWQDHAEAVTGRLAVAAGACGTVVERAERRTLAPGGAGTEQPTVGAAVAWCGLPSVRYHLARTSPGRVARLARLVPAGIDPLYPVQQSHASAVSTRRWAADLGLAVAEPTQQGGELLTSAAERTLLGMLPWLPVRIATAARLHRPDELPRYLEAVSDAWLAVRQEAPALPFGGRAAPADAATAGARLMLADAVEAVLAAGMALIGVPVCGGDD